MLKLRPLLFLLTSLAVLLGWPSLAYAANDASQAIAQSYGANTTLRQGMIVELEKKDNTKVRALPEGDLRSMLGVVIGANDAALTLSGEANASQIYVANLGRYNVLVSTQNGAINVNDYVSISALDGIGMKADSTQPAVLGKAAGNFSGLGTLVSTATLKFADGHTKAVAIGLVPVDINISNNPGQTHSVATLPGFLQVSGSAIADKPVTVQRTYLAVAVLLLTALVAGSLLYAGVRNGLVAIGRNPLAKPSIIRGLVQVVITSIIVFILGLFGVYLLLRL